jgi:uncharacterized protein YdcH (DUF465 family)
MDRNDPFIVSLIEGNDEFRRLFGEHEEIEQKLSAFDSIHYLTPQEDLERKRLQKIKLHGRDRMEQILHEAKGEPHPS